MVVNRFFTMKKIFFIVGAIVLLVSGVLFMSSCKIFTRKLTCNCYTTDNVSQSKFESDLQKALNSVATDFAADCNDVESKMRSTYGYYNVSCY